MWEVLPGVSHPTRGPAVTLEAQTALVELVPKETCWDQSAGIHLHQQVPLEMPPRVTHQCRDRLGTLADVNQPLADVWSWQH